MGAKLLYAQTVAIDFMLALINRRIWIFLILE